jgi:hypothetical protein
MSEETARYKIPMLFEEDIAQIKTAIIVAQNYYGNVKAESLHGNSYCTARIEELAKVWNKLNEAPWKELPTPNTLNK